MDREAQYLSDRLTDTWTALDRARVTVWRRKLAILGQAVTFTAAEGADQDGRVIQ